MFHTIALPGYLFILCELVLYPSASSSGGYGNKGSGIEIEREVRCARSKPSVTSKIEHVYVYDVSVLFFDKNLLDFPFNLIQSENEVENDIHIGFSSPTHSTAKFVTVRSHSIFKSTGKWYDVHFLESVAGGT